MKLITQLLIFILAIFLTTNGYAQTTKTTTSKSKVVIIKTVTDDNGNTTTEKIVKIIKNPKIVELDGITIHGDEESIVFINEDDIERKTKLVKIDVDVTDTNGQKTIKIIKVNDDNEPEIIEWSGDGEIPEHLKEKLKSLDIEILDENGKIIHFDEDQLNALEKSGNKIIIIENDETEIKED